jgi:hypothetical protein
VLFPAIGFFVTVTPEKLASHELDASVEASEPHDFAVRLSAVRQKRCPRPPHPVPTFVTMANAPLEGRDGGTCRVICEFGKPEYFFKTGWTEVAENNEVICPSGRNGRSTDRVMPGLSRP